MGNKKVNFQGKEYKRPTGAYSATLTDLINDELKLLYFTSEIISKETIHIFNQNPQNVLTQISWETNENLKIRKATGSYIYEFLQDVNKEIWLSLLYKIIEYRKRFTQMASELINKGTIGDLNKLNK